MEEPQEQQAAHAAGSVEQGDQYVVFRIADEEYAAPILDIQEIVPAGDITPFPNAPSYVLGITNVRGTVATVISLAKLFNISKGEGLGVNEGNVILSKDEHALYGMQVDAVSSVMRLERDAIRPASSASGLHIDSDYIEGIAVINDRVILILDLRKILRQDEKEKLAEAVPLAVPAPVQAPSA